MCAALNPIQSAAMLPAGALPVFLGGNAGNLLLNLNNYSNSQQSHLTATSAATSSSASSNFFNDKLNWMNRIETGHIDRGLMNKLVMNYLVTGEA